MAAGSTKELDRNKLITDHFGMVQRIASRMSARYPSSVELDDLISIGALGLIDAADRYDETRNATFSTYALIRVKGAIVDALRQQDWVPRSVRSRNREIERAKEAAQTETGVADTAKVAASLGVDIQTLANMERDSQVFTQVSMWDRRADADQSIADTLESHEVTPTEALDEGDVRRVLLEAIDKLPERDQAIVRMYYFEDRTFREIGDILGVTESRISQVHSRIRRRLREHLPNLP